MQERSMLIDGRQVEEVMDKENADIPGVSIAFVGDKGTVSTMEFGFTDKSLTTKVNPETIFGAASLSKSVFAYLILKLIENREYDFDLNTKLDEILSFNKFCKKNNFAWGKTDKDIERVKLLDARMVLSHTTGLDLFRGSIDFDFEPSKEYRYSGLPIFYLQKVIEKLTNLTLEELAQKYVFGPLDMKGSCFYRNYDLGLISDAERHPRKIYLGVTDQGLQYEVIGLDGKLKNNTIPWDKLPKDFLKNSAEIIQSKEKFLPILLEYTSNAGHTTSQKAIAPNSLYTTAEDYARFVRAWMNDPTLQYAFEPHLLMMTNNKINDQWAHALNVPDEDMKHVACGLGWELETNDQGDVIRAYKTGDMNQWRGEVAIDFEKKTAIVFFANSSNGHLLADQIISPNVELKHGLNYFFQKYGFARILEPDWQKKEKAKMDEIGAYLELHSGLSVSNNEMAGSVFGRSSNTAKMLERQTTTAKLMGSALTHKPSNSKVEPSFNEDAQKGKEKSVDGKPETPAEGTVKSTYKTPTLKPRGYK